MSKVDIKEMCKRFETMSNSNDRNGAFPDERYSDYSTPKVPVRRRRSEILNIKKTADCAPNEMPNAEKNDRLPVNNLKSERMSVRERSKLFETPKSHVIPSNITPMKEEVKYSAVVKTAIAKAPRKDYVNTPPIKPPRSAKNKAEETNTKTRVANHNSESSDSSAKSEPFVRRNSSPNVENGKLKNKAGRTSKLLNSEILPKLRHRAMSKSQKTHSILNYFRTLTSNAYEKMKQKHSSIFVDLTPTTVTPPKNYDTLKRSHSEEHIYAEPFTLEQTTPMKKESSDKSPPLPLHYMCTPVTDIKIPEKRKYGQLRCTKNSMRCMIYDSFSTLRIPVVKDEPSTNKSTPDDTDSDVSVKDVQERIIYVRSLKKQCSAASLSVSAKLYEALYVINISKNQPEITFKFPKKLREGYDYPLLPHICFPDVSFLTNINVYKSDTFHFSLVDEKEQQIFGYCHRILGWPENSSGLQMCPLFVKLPVAICILSSFSAPIFYKKLLVEIEKHLNSPKEKFFHYIASLQELGVPNAGASLSIPDYTEPEEKRAVLLRPLDSHFVGYDFTRALQLLDADILIKAVASLLLERRVLLFSAFPDNLYHCSKAITSLLYPFEWQHLIIPILPSYLLVQCSTESPYVFGILSSDYASILDLLVEQQLLIIDVDKGIILKSCDDEDTILPKKIWKAVVTALNLAKNMTDPTEMLRDVMISEAFVHMFVEMIGHYGNHFVEQEGATLIQKEAFQKSAFSHSIRSFLEWFSETQMFDVFIEECLWRIKYRTVCQTSLQTCFEKRVDEYKWELSQDNNIAHMIGKRVRNFGEKLRGFKKI